MATPSTRQAIVQAILKRRNNESFHREKKSMKGYVPSYLEGDEKCVVCGDKATGYHYKCITCEGCKGFFRRTVQKSLESSYQCKHSSNCDINKVTRNQCQLCRYKKCIGVGMAKDLVLDEDKRLAKRKLIEQNRELRRHKELSQMMAQCGWRIERPTDDERRLIHDVTQAYFQANDIQNKTTSSTCNGLAVAERFSTALTAAITNVVDFAKRIPLFVNHVSTEDQVLILKVCCMEVITLRCVTSYKNSTKKVTLFPTVDVTRDQLRFTRLEPFSDSLFALAEHLNSMDLTPVEIALLQASLIFSGDRPGISERIRLDHAQNIILRAFEHHLNELWPHDPKYCPSLLMKLTDVRTVSACLADTLMSMRMDDPQELGRLFYPAETVPAMPIPYPHINLHQPFKSPSMPDKCSQSFFHSSGKHRAVVKSFSLPHLNGIKTVHQNVHTCGPSGRVNSLTYANFNTKSRLQELVDKRPDQVSPEHNHILLSSGLPSTSALPAQLLPPDSEHHPPANNEICRLSSKRNGIRLSTGNGVKYNPLSSECVKYETYRNSHNKVFERMTKATRTSSSLSDDTNLISRFDLNNPIHFDNGHSHSVPSSPNKGSEIYQRQHPTPEISKHRRLDMAPQEYRYSCPVQQFRTVPRQVSTTVNDSNDIRLAGTCFFIGVDEASNGDHRRSNNGHYENEILMKSSQANIPTALSCSGEDKSRDLAQQCAESQISLSGPSPFFELFRVQPAGCRGNNGTELPTPLSAQSQSETDKMAAFHDKLEPNKGHQNKSKRPISSPTFPSSKVKCVNRNCDESEHNRANTTHISTTNSYSGNGIIMRPVITTNADGSHFGIPLQKRPKSC